MTDFIGISIIIVIAILCLLILYVFSTFGYKIVNGYLEMEWKIFKYINFQSRKIKIEDIENVDYRKADKSCTGFDLFGNLFTKEPLILYLKKGLLFRKRIYITPVNPQAFIEEIKNVLTGVKT